MSSPAHVAQAAEHFLGKEKVPGSNPGVGSHFFSPEVRQGDVIKDMKEILGAKEEN